MQMICMVWVHLCLGEFRCACGFRVGGTDAGAIHIGEFQSIVQVADARNLRRALLITTQLAEMKGQSARGFMNDLGIVVASKLLFFTCPEMPIFIYDSVVGKALSMEHLTIRDYFEFWQRCKEILERQLRTIMGLTGIAEG